MVDGRAVMEPDAIREQRFLLVRRGYDPEAVQAFLDDVADAVEELRDHLDDPGSDSTTELTEARRLVDDARTRAATHRLRAQRDVEALERAARQRRARLLGEIEELAAARDQLSDDLDRAVDVVDRVVQWVRRTDPTATAPAPEAVATTAAVTGLDEVPADDADRSAGSEPGPDDSTGPVPPDRGDDGQADESTRPDAEQPDTDEVAGPDTDDKAGPDTDEQAGPDTEPADPAGAEQTEVDRAVEPDEPEQAEAGRASEPDEPEQVEPDDPQPAEPGSGPDPGDEAEPGDVGEPGDRADGGRGHESKEPAPPVTEAPGIADVRTALRAVQDEVLANLRDHPRGEVADWLPGRPVLDALDDAATDAARDAFLAGWETAAPGATPDATPDANADATSQPTPDVARGRDALERVHAAGDLPSLAVAGELAATLEASLARGRDAGEVEVALRERAAEVHRDLRQTRLAEAVEQVVASAHHHGRLARWSADGVTAVAWVEGDEQRCPGRRCRGNATDGVVAPGAPFAFGDVAPPAHPGCTCTLRPVDPPAEREGAEESATD